MQLEALLVLEPRRALQHAVDHVSAFGAVELRRVHEHHHEAGLRAFVVQEAVVEGQGMHPRHQRIHLGRVARQLFHHGHHAETHQRVIAQQGEQVRLAEHGIDAVELLEVLPQCLPGGKGLGCVEGLALHAHHHHVAVLAELPLEIGIGDVRAVRARKQTAVLVAHTHGGGLVSHERGDEADDDEDRQSIAQYAASQPVPHSLQGRGAAGLPHRFALRADRRPCAGSP